ncbi:hypothetical protein [Actinoplanes sp. NPDC051851]|uniref:hypothetical protein n=1 Tax=Actinoplanes sp. NPDC051851 TaxID=3154753 RepID=UPI0034337618
MTGIDWRTGRTVVAGWPPGGSPRVLAGHLTYRGETVRLGTADHPEATDRVVAGSVAMANLRQGVTWAAEHYFGLLAGALPAGGGPVVVAVPAWLADDDTAVRYLHDLLVGTLRLPVDRVVGTPIAAAAYAYAVGALPPDADAVVVCDVDETGAMLTVLGLTVLGAGGARMGSRPAVGVPLQAGNPDRDRLLGKAVAAAALAAGLRRQPLHLITLGLPEGEAAVAAAAEARHRASVTPVALPEPLPAAALGAAAIAAGRVTVDDVCPYEVALAVHEVAHGLLANRWERLDADRPVEVEAGPGTTVLRVRLTANGHPPYETELAPALPAGTYRAEAVSDSGGLAVLFHQPGASALRVPVHLGKAAS